MRIAVTLCAVVALCAPGAVDIAAAGRASA
jgi:hypothetical protein